MADAAIATTERMTRALQQDGVRGVVAVIHRLQVD
jgi:hypothetical protein